MPRVFTIGENLCARNGVDKVMGTKESDHSPVPIPLSKCTIHVSAYSAPQSADLIHRPTLVLDAD